MVVGAIVEGECYQVPFLSLKFWISALIWYRLRARGGRRRALRGDCSSNYR